MTVKRKVLKQKRVTQGRIILNQRRTALTQRRIVLKQMRIILEQGSKVRQKRTMLKVQNVVCVLRMMMLDYGYAVMFVIPGTTSSALILNQRKIIPKFYYCERYK